MANMAAFLDRESQDPGSGSVDSVTTQMFGAMGNLLGAASDVVAVSQPNTTKLTSARIDKQQRSHENRRATVSSRLCFLFAIFTQCQVTDSII